jgi:hypothetical protein
VLGWAGDMSSTVPFIVMPVPFGTEMSGAVTVVAYLSCNTSYYTDFTNAWVTPRLFIRALSENEVMVSLDRQTLS